MTGGKTHVSQSLSTQSTGEGAGKYQDDVDLDQDEIFHVLRNHRRRYALHYLRYRDGEADIGEMAEQIAAWENEIKQVEVDSTQRKRVYNALQQTHLPELDETGVVDYEKRSGTVTIDAGFEDLDIYLELVPGREIPWSLYYLGLGALGLTLVLAAVTNTMVFGEIGGIAYATFLAVALTVSAVVNVYYQARNRLGEAEKPPEIRQIEE